MKKLLAVLMAAMMLFALCACQGEQAETAKPGEDAAVAASAGMTRLSSQATSIISGMVFVKVAFPLSRWV